jgi:hypothetical protein
VRRRPRPSARHEDRPPAPRRPPLIAGVGILAIVAVQLGLSGLVALRNVDWQRIKPVWMLVREGRDSTTHTAALEELCRRLQAKSLSPTQVSAVADAALAEQARTDKTWQATWGDFVEQAKGRKLLTDDRWRRYVAQALESSMAADGLRVWAPAAGGTLLPLSLHFAPAKMGSKQRTRLAVTTQLRMAAGEFLSESQRPTQLVRYLDSSRRVAVSHMHYAALDPVRVAADNLAHADADDPPHAIAVIVEASVADQDDPWPREPLAAKRFTFTGTWSHPEVTPAAQSSR